MTTDWTIQSRAHQCAATAHEFTEGEFYYTLLYLENGAYRREDLCEDAFKNRAESPSPFSYWRAKYVPPPPAQAETVSKQTAEDLLRRYMLEDGVEHTNARYILALMLERKRILKEVEVKRGDDGSLTRIYEHGKSGEVFIIPDPQLRLDQVADVQVQVASLLGGPSPTASPVPAATPAPETAPVEALEPTEATAEQISETPTDQSIEAATESPDETVSEESPDEAPATTPHPVE